MSQCLYNSSRGILKTYRLRSQTVAFLVSLFLLKLNDSSDKTDTNYTKDLKNLEQSLIPGVLSTKGGNAQYIIGECQLCKKKRTERPALIKAKKDIRVAAL